MQLVGCYGSYWTSLLLVVHRHIAYRYYFSPLANQCKCPLLARLFSDYYIGYNGGLLALLLDSQLLPEEHWTPVLKRIYDLPLCK